MNDIVRQHFCCPVDCVAPSMKVNGSRAGSAENICIPEGFNGLPFSLRQSILCGSGDTPVGTNTPIEETLQQLIYDLRHERYVKDSAKSQQLLSSAVASTYYRLRPILPLFVRRRALRAYLWARKNDSFPRWPIDTTVDDLLEGLMYLEAQRHCDGRVPFIWFWPDGATSCAIMTHDVEAADGYAYCDALMDLDDGFGIPASFQLVPEERYAISEALLCRMRTRHFEINIQDLNHDGLLFRDRRDFLSRADKINFYAAKFQARGFRSAILFRNQKWYDAFGFEYDMSVPNVARFDPQKGGCCTVMPYFIGNILELPVTTIQDYSLFYLLNDYSVDLWKRQTNAIMAKHGLMSFIVHPDYVRGRRELQTYKELLRHLAHLRDEHHVWVTTPGEVNRWWRCRSEMSLVSTTNGWSIQGPGSDRAHVVYARRSEGRLVYEMEPASVHA